MNAWFSKLSIVKRITLLLTFSSTALLVLLTIFLYSGVVNISRLSNMQQLDDEFHYVKKTIYANDNFLYFLNQQFNSAPRNIKELEKGNKWLLPYDYLRLVNEKGERVIETPGMSEIINYKKFTQQSPMINRKSEITLWHSKNNHDYYILRGLIKGSPPESKHYEVQIALDVTEMRSIFNTYRHLLYLALLVAAFIIFFISQWIANVVMRDLKKLTRETQNITIERIDNRFEEKQWAPELRPLVASLNKSLAQINHCYKDLYQFSADLAHEIRTPINNLIASTEVTLSQQRAPDEYRHILSSNLEEFERITDLVERLLFLARAENKRLAINKQHFLVENELKLLYDYFEFLTEDKGIEFSYSGHASLVADMTLFRQALSNIISNAIKFTSSGGRINISIKENKKNIIINIQDTGSGIASNMSPHIFDRFYSVNQETQSKIGAGLGLSIVQSIMNLHDGSVNIDSQLGVGTAVQLIFPNLNQS